VLEIGCGVGGFGARLAERCEYVGIEMDETSFRVAKERVESVGGRVVLGTLDDLEPSAFDVVCAFEVLEHIDDDESALRAWSSRLVPGGSIVLSVPAFPERFGECDEAVGHYRRYTADSLSEVLKRAGCDDITHTYYGWPLGLATEAFRHWVIRRRQRSAPESMSARTAESGRFLQPGRSTGGLVRVGTAPFSLVQRLRPDRGVGLVATARLAA
jgi:SAM-dependent methyltransferase